MNPKLLRRLLVSVVVVGAFAGLYYYTHAPLLRIRLKDGTEIRVLKVAYGTGVNQEHELIAPSRLKLRLLGLLPQSWQRRIYTPVNYPASGWARPSPVVSVWWSYHRPSTSTEKAHSASNAIITIPSNAIGMNPRPVGIADRNGNVALIYSQYELEPGKPDKFTFSPPPPPAKTLTVHLKVNREPVDFTVPIPAPSE